MSATPSKKVSTWGMVVRHQRGQISGRFRSPLFGTLLSPESRRQKNATHSRSQIFDDGFLVQKMDPILAPEKASQK
jgi:hypothetical protein